MKFPVFYISVILILFLVYMGLGFESHLRPSGQSLESPSFSHILGTDDLGIDIAAQLVYGGGYSLIIGGVSALLATLAGVMLGIAAGFYQGRIDRFVMGVIDALASIPQMILLILMGVFLESNWFSLILVLTFVSWRQTARMVRAKVIFLKNETYIKMSELYGARFFFIAWHHIIPAIRELIVLSFIKIMSRVIVMEASLAYLGLSDPTAKSWGKMLNRAMSFSGIYFTSFWKWWLLPPLIALILFIVSLMLLSRKFERSSI